MCFKVTRHQISYVVSGIIVFQYQEDWPREMAGISFSDPMIGQKLGETLMRLNYEAFELRYPHMPKDVVRYQFVELVTTKIQALKYFDCLITQCEAGGREIQQRSLYRAMNVLAGAMARQILQHNSTAYLNARWEA